ncbi:LuxR C-terminal-related transcriptional regulator [Arthrobacter sp. Z1-9]
MIAKIMQTVGPGNHGVLLAGEPGTGKTVLLEHVGRTLARDMFPVQVRGSSIGARTEYGALRFLLDGMEADQPNHPVPVFQQLSKLLRVRSQGRTLVLLVDNAHLLDELAAAIIGLLVRSGQARAIIACNGVGALSADLVSLGKDGLLDFQDIESFTPAETSEWVVSTLGADVSRLAVETLWENSGGNPLILKTLVREQVRTGSLVNKNGTYVLTATPVLGGKPLSDVVAAHFSRLSLEEREVLELLALSGGLSPENLLGIAPPAALASLMERGLTCRAPGGAIIRVKSPAVAEIIRREVPAGRSMQLRKLLGNVLNLSGGAGVRCKAYASWQLATGSALEPELVFGAVDEATRIGDGHAALRFLAQLTNRRINYRAVLGEARALLQLGRQAEAEEVLENFSANHLNSLPLASVADFLLTRASLACIQKDAPSEAEGHLRELRERLGDDPAATKTLRNIRDRLTLAEATVSSYQGHYAPSIAALTTLYVNNRAASEELRLRAGALLAEALAMIGRQDDAVRVAEEVGQRMDVPELTEGLRYELRARFVPVYLTAGLWNRCADVLDSTPRAVASPMVPRHGLAAVGAGLIHAYAGRAGQVLEALVPTLEQLRMMPSGAVLGVALAAASYAYALQGKFEDSRNCLRELKTLTPPNGPMYKAPLEYFSALATAVDGGHGAVDHVLQLADQEQRAGRISNELFLLAAAVRLGEVAASPRLLAVARRCQGVFAEACSLLATGLMAENPELLLVAGELARGFGDEGFCRDTALAAHQVAVRTANRTTAKRALNLAAESERKMHGQSPRQAALERLDVLTSRERDIVERASAGASNKDIAQQLHISVRTVEGHLYQSYTKLQISGRDLLHGAGQDDALLGGNG